MILLLLIGYLNKHIIIDCRIEHEFFRGVERESETVHAVLHVEGETEGLK